jgi:hypothetical protein
MRKNQGRPQGELRTALAGRNHQQMTQAARNGWQRRGSREADVAAQDGRRASIGGIALRGAPVFGRCGLAPSGLLISSDAPAVAYLECPHTGCGAVCQEPWPGKLAGRVLARPLPSAPGAVAAGPP